jgi:HSP20 family protein
LWKFGGKKAMEKKHQKKLGIDNYYKDWFENFFHPISRMALTPDFRKVYFYEAPLFITPKRMLYINGFGNIIHPNNHQEMSRTKELKVEVIESKKTVSITSDLACFEIENIDLEITPSIVSIKFNNGKEKCYKKVKLPCNVDVDSVISSYNNGILDIQLKKVISNKDNVIKIV